MSYLPHIFFFFFFNDTATTEIYTLSLHDALPIFERRSIRFDDAVAKRLEIALEVRQRGPQLVGRIGDELATHPLLFLERGRHLVERVGQADDLVRTTPRDPGSVVAARDLPGGRADVLERPRESGREHAGENHGGDDGDDGRRDDDPDDGVGEHGL